ncbi:hypothetical protein T492DRAFT_894447 [Pavlovales sp. CCMP2436]|nr:hypothetical protein T492DRAFT_894447 [Pavlovales sp. CCMP2436]
MSRVASSFITTDFDEARHLLNASLKSAAADSKLYSTPVSSPAKAATPSSGPSQAAPAAGPPTADAFAALKARNDTLVAQAAANATALRVSHQLSRDAQLSLSAERRGKQARTVAFAPPEEASDAAPTPNKRARGAMRSIARRGKGLGAPLAIAPSTSPPALPGARGSFERAGALTTAQHKHIYLAFAPAGTAAAPGARWAFCGAVASLRSAVNIDLRAGLAALNLAPAPSSGMSCESFGEYVACIGRSVQRSLSPAAQRARRARSQLRLKDLRAELLGAFALEATVQALESDGRADADWFRSWADAIPSSAAAAFGDVPANAHDRPMAPPPSMDFADFSHNGAAFDPPRSVRSALPARQRPALVPRSINYILMSAAIDAIDGWISRELADLRAHSLDLPLARRRNRPLALGAEDLQPGAAGFTVRTTLDGARFAKLMGPDYPDQALTSVVSEGVVYDAEIEHQIVLLPNLLSMANVMETVRAEIERMASLNRVTLHTFLLYPMPPHHRLQLAAHCPLSSADGDPVISISAAADIKGTAEDGRSQRLPRGVKPDVAGYRTDAAILQRCAIATGEQLLGFCDHCVLGFGMAASSNYAQRLATAVAREVARRMDSAEAPILDEMRRSGSPPLLALLSRQDALSARTGREQARLFSLAIGQWLITLGIGFALTLEIVCGLAAKVLTATSALQRILHGEVVSFTDFRRVTGLLEHFKSALDLLGSLSYSFYDDSQLGLLDPCAPIATSAAMIDSCRRWMGVLRTSTCNSFAPSVYSGRPALTGSARILVYSDASELGLGVFCHVFYVYHELEDSAALLPMAVLEFVALFLAVLKLSHFVRGLGVAWHTYSSVVRAIVTKMSASSVLTRLVHFALLAAHCPLSSADGDPVISISAAADIKGTAEDGRSQRLPREVKPDVAGYRTDAAILQRCAIATGEQLLGFCDHCVLGFGMAASSNYAQRLATAVAREVARRMDSAEAPILDEMRRSGSPPLLALLSRQDALSARTGREQARLFSLAIGQWLITLGIGFALTLEIVCGLAAKVLTATSALQRILHGEVVSFTDFRRVTGLLEHFKSALDLLGSLSYSFYDDSQLGLLDPCAPIATIAAMIDSCRRWMGVLRTSTCNSFAPSVYSGRPALTGSARILVYSDASELGLGVFCHSAAEPAAPPAVGMDAVVSPAAKLALARALRPVSSFFWRPPLADTGTYFVTNAWGRRHPAAAARPPVAAPPQPAGVAWRTMAATRPFAAVGCAVAAPGLLGLRPQSVGIGRFGAMPHARAALAAEVWARLRAAVPPGTSRVDASAWRRWEEFCRGNLVSLHRPDARWLDAPAAAADTSLLVRFLVAVCRTMKPRRAADIVHRVIKGLTRKFVDFMGAAALRPRRKRTLTEAIVISMLDAASGKPVRSGTVDWSVHIYSDARAAWLLMWCSEMGKDDAFNLRTDSINLRADGGIEAIVIPHGSHQLDADAALRHSLEGRTASARLPFFHDAARAPLPHIFLERLFEDVIRLVLPADKVADYSNHSFWIGCATTLLAAGFPLLPIIYLRAGINFYTAPMAALRPGGVADSVALAAEPFDIDAHGSADEAFAAIRALALSMAA